MLLNVLLTVLQILHRYDKILNLSDGLKIRPNNFTFGNLEVEYSESNQGKDAAGYQGMEYLVKDVDLQENFHTNQIFLEIFTLREFMLFFKSRLPEKIEA